MDFSIGQNIGCYRIVRPLGHGGMGSVYEVVHARLGVHYALKVFSLERGNVDEFRRRFDAEGRVLARLSHRNLVRVIDLDVDEVLGVRYFVMDLVVSADGTSRTLADVDPGSVDEMVIRRWFVELCDALAYIHGKGIVHRDIKLGNILLADDGRVVLSDFGISRFRDADLRSAIDITRTIFDSSARSVMGTVGYMAPELQKGYEATRSSDVYALGVVFFKLLTNLWYDPSLAARSDRSAISHGADALMLLGMLDLDWKSVLPLMLDEDPGMRPLDLEKLPGLLGDPDSRAPRPGIMKGLLVALCIAVVSLLVWIGLSWLLRPDPRVAEFNDAFSVRQVLEGLK